MDWVRRTFGTYGFLGIFFVSERGRSGWLTVHTFVAFREKGKLGIPIKDVDEYLSFLRAQYTLWPMEKTRKTLENLENSIAAGVNIVFGSVE